MVLFIYLRKNRIALLLNDTIVKFGNKNVVQRGRKKLESTVKTFIEEMKRMIQLFHILYQNHWKIYIQGSI